MKRITFLLVAVMAVAGVVASVAPTGGHADEQASPIYGVTIPPGYRDWKLIAVSEIAAGDKSQLRAEFGNDIAIKSFKEGKLPFPDGAIVVAQHWTKESSPENDKVLSLIPMVAGLNSPKSFIPGSFINVQFMVKDSKKYAATGGWGFADFKDGKPGDEALHKTCFPCHQPAKDHDFVYTHYAP
ncbi:MAG TPA: cytochrome P460 family protein [Terriglobales bacterium]|nr:cytochrome P460 family protein [Terriglobales bacterium]